MKEIYMQYPYDKKNVFYDGKMHKIYPKKIYALNNQYFILIYDDLKIGRANMITILEKVEGFNLPNFRKVPLTNYSDLNKFMQRTRLKEQSLDLIKSDITEVTGEQDFNDIIDEISINNRKRTRVQVASATVVPPSPPSPPVPPNNSNPSNTQKNAGKLMVKVLQKKPDPEQTEENLNINLKNNQMTQIDIYVNYSFNEEDNGININGIFNYIDNFKFMKISMKEFNKILNMEILERCILNNINNTNLTILCNNYSINITAVMCVNKMDGILTRLNDIIKINVPIGIIETPKNAFVLAYKKHYHIEYSIHEGSFKKRFKI